MLQCLIASSSGTVMAEGGAAITQLVTLSMP